MKNGNTRRKLVPALALMLVAAVALTSSSYAWFTMSRKVTADGISLKAVAPTNLLISSTEDGTYTEHTEVLQRYGGKIIPASSWNGLEFWKAESISSDNLGAPSTSTVFTKALTPLSTENNNNGYYADFKLWLATTGAEDVKINVSKLLSYFSDAPSYRLVGVSNDEDFTSKKNNGEIGYYSESGSATILPIGEHAYNAEDKYYTTQNTSLSKATRFAILNGDGDALLTSGNSTDNVFGYYSLDNGVTDPISNVDFFDTVVGGEAIVGPLKSTDYAGNVAPAAIGEDINENDAINVNAPDADYLFTVAKMTDQEIAEGKLHGTPTAITVRVWIEGQDKECITGNANAAINLNIGFKDVSFTD